MNVYEVGIWYRVNHNGKFSHNVQRVELIHALNEERARIKVVLKEASRRNFGNILIEASGEFIYSIRKTGTVVIKPFYVYSDGRIPRPVGEE